MDTKRLHKLGSDLAHIAAELSCAPAYSEPDPFQFPVAKIRDVLRSRRLRERLLPVGLFADPALDMLLELTLHQAEGTTVSITDLCNSVSVAPTTGLRWISQLQTRGLIERALDSADRRKTHLRLTESGTAAMASYMAAVKQADLPLA
ncbi:MAG: hypothetical protein EON58_04360 [Alphaproteobacteria bacterium]|nr:MAG: hypothetical protein EON58_04360 [Alphaproteobacteria bacterium]